MTAFKKSFQERVEAGISLVSVSRATAAAEIVGKFGKVQQQRAKEARLIADTEDETRLT